MQNEPYQAYERPVEAILRPTPVAAPLSTNQIAVSNFIHQQTQLATVFFKTEGGFIYNFFYPISSFDLIFSGNPRTEPLHISIYFCSQKSKIKCLNFQFSRRQETQISRKVSFDQFSNRSRPIRLQFLIWRVNEADRVKLRDLRSHIDLIRTSC